MEHQSQKYEILTVLQVYLKSVNFGTFHQQMNNVCENIHQWLKNKGKHTCLP